MEAAKSLRSYVCFLEHENDWMSDYESVFSDSYEEQVRTEADCGLIYKKLLTDLQASDPDHVEETFLERLDLKRLELRRFIRQGLLTLSPSYGCLDASRPWLCYWMLHSAELLEITIPDEQKTSITEFLGRCQCDSGGFGGGPSQHPHLAPTYAAVSALCIIGTKQAFQVINRKSLFEFLLKMHQADGSFIMHHGGEVDLRGSYLAAAVAHLTNIVTDELFHDSCNFIRSCQTYEGGFGAVPHMEAHGGYAYCGVAAFSLLSSEFQRPGMETTAADQTMQDRGDGDGDRASPDEVTYDVEALLKWTVERQMRVEGGFQGRTNKLVDSCYSFWQGAIIPAMLFLPSVCKELSPDNFLFHNSALQEYILICCQYHKGGFIDKPTRFRDYYHTCYALSGLSIAQHFTFNGQTCVLGRQTNLLVKTHPLFNISYLAAGLAQHYFNGLDPPTAEWKK